MAAYAFLNVPGHGHVNPTLAVAKELVRRAHRSRFRFIQPSGGFEQGVDAFGQSARVAARVERDRSLRPLGRFTLPRCVTRDHRKARKQVLQNLVRHRQVATRRELHFSGEPDVVLGNPRQELVVRHEIMYEKAPTPFLGDGARHPFEEARRRPTAQMHLRLVPDKRQRGEEVLEPPTTSERLREPVNGGEP